MRVHLCLPEVDPHHVVLHLAPEEHRREDGDGTGAKPFSEGGHPAARRVLSLHALCQDYGVAD